MRNIALILVLFFLSTGISNQAKAAGDGDTYVLVNELTLGKDYIIANGNSGTVTILGQSSGSQKRTTVEVTTGDTPYIETGNTDFTNYVWNAKSRDTSFEYPRLINNGYAVYPSSSKLSFSNSSNTSGGQYTRYWVYEDGALAGISTNNSDTYYMTYTSSAFTTTSTAPSNTIYIFEKQTSGDEGGEEGGEEGGDEGGQGTTTSIGDINGDGQITAQDAALILMHIAGKINLDDSSTYPTDESESTTEE